MRYWSKGLGHRSALHIEWSREKIDISIREGHLVLKSVVPSPLFRVEVAPGEQVVISGQTLPPVVWRYVSVLGKQDFGDILRLATDPVPMVDFLTHSRGGRSLFLRLAWPMVVFLWRYLQMWVAWKLKNLTRPQAQPRPQAPMGRLTPARTQAQAQIPGQGPGLS